MNKQGMIIICLSSISVMLLVASVAFLVSIGPLEQHQFARTVVIDLYNMDPKVQRDTVSGTLQMLPEEFATNTLQYFSQYLYIPISTLALSAVLTLISLFMLRTNKKISGSLFMFAAAASCFSVIPPLLQVIAGSMLLKVESKEQRLKAAVS